jgi:cation diffusion facilitator CzcD-associated flavoprotein CzcO
MAPHATDDKAPTEEFKSSSNFEDGATSVEAQARWAQFNYLHPGYSITEHPLGTLKKVKIICIGAGAATINFCHEADLQLKNFEIVAYDKNPEIGGTWYENRYPGCACDIPSVNYQYTWHPHIWTSYYSSAPEILSYFKEVVEKYNLGKYMRLNSKVIGCRWDEEQAKWFVKVDQKGNVFEDSCDILVSATGVLNAYKYPDIPGLQNFKGILAHSANYPVDLELKDKTVAVIGAGSSGVQIVSNITPMVGKLINFIRSPTWITAGFAQK